MSTDITTNEFLTESASFLSPLPSIVPNSLKSITNLDKLCFKVSKRILLLSRHTNESKSKEHEKNDEIKYLKSLHDCLYEKKLAIIASTNDVLDHHVSRWIDFMHCLLTKCIHQICIYI